MMFRGWSPPGPRLRPGSRDAQPPTTRRRWREVPACRKHGLTTGTTIGRVNGLESFRRVDGHHGISNKSLEIAVLPYDKTHSKFSDAGDSGSVVLDRAGRIVGILTGGSGATDATGITYLTPYWWVEEQVKAKFPSCFLYEVVQ